MTHGLSGRRCSGSTPKRFWLNDWVLAAAEIAALRDKRAI